VAGWRRYAGPAAFLLAVTIAVLLVRSGLRSGHKRDAPPAGATITRPIATVPTTTATSTKQKAQAKRYWTVRAGDTFGVISAQSGVPVATIEQLNPTVKSTSLHIGEKLRIR
jgi:LysM repeat protein